MSDTDTVAATTPAEEMPIHDAPQDDSAAYLDGFMAEPPPTDEDTGEHDLPSSFGLTLGHRLAQYRDQRQRQAESESERRQREQDEYRRAWEGAHREVIEKFARDVLGLRDTEQIDGLRGQGKQANRIALPGVDSDLLAFVTCTYEGGHGYSEHWEAAETWDEPPKDWELDLAATLKNVLEGAWTFSISSYHERGPCYRLYQREYHLLTSAPYRGDNNTYALGLGNTLESAHEDILRYLADLADHIANPPYYLVEQEKRNEEWLAQETAPKQTREDRLAALRREWRHTYALNGPFCEVTATDLTQLAAIGWEFHIIGTPANTGGIEYLGPLQVMVELFPPEMRPEFVAVLNWHDAQAFKDGAPADIQHGANSLLNDGWHLEHAGDLKAAANGKGLEALYILSKRPPHAWPPTEASEG